MYSFPLDNRLKPYLIIGNQYIAARILAKILRGWEKKVLQKIHCSSCLTYTLLLTFPKTQPELPDVPQQRQRREGERERGTICLTF